MAEATKIQWVGSTWNPWRGCEKVHAGCDHCYAEALSHRNPSQLGVWGPDGTRVAGAEAMWNAPLRWQKRAEKTGVRHSCFPSLMDPFEDRADLVPLRDRMFGVIDRCPLVDFLLLTKRPENVRRMCLARSHGSTEAVAAYWKAMARSGRDPKGHVVIDEDAYRPNVWIGTSISDQEAADKYVPELLKLRDLTPVLFLSIEPLLGPVRLWSLPDPVRRNGSTVDALTGGGMCVMWDGGVGMIASSPKRLDWVIVGGESGPKARPCRPEWVRSIVKQCRSASVPVFVKQMGGNVITRNDQIEDVFNNGSSGWPDPEVEHDIHGYREEYQGADCRIRLRDPKGGDPDEWPEDLRVREFPDAKGGVS